MCLSRHLKNSHQGMAPKDYFHQHVYSSDDFSALEAEDLVLPLLGPLSSPPDPTTSARKKSNNFKLKDLLSGIKLRGDQVGQQRDNDDSGFEYCCQYDECGVFFLGEVSTVTSTLLIHFTSQRYMTHRAEMTQALWSSLGSTQE